MPLFRATIRIPMFTQVPEDVVTNTLYFDFATDDPIGAPTSGLITDLQNFYNTAFAGGMMSPVMVSSGARLLLYRMSDTEPRAPYLEAPLALNGTIEGATGYVEEAAVCLSFQAPRLSGQPQARRRGRIYLGCLSTSAIAGGSAAQFSSVISTFRNQIATAATTLASTGTLDRAWVVYSPTSGFWNTVTEGWIDVNPDTQRRRGQRAPQRTLWTD